MRFPKKAAVLALTSLVGICTAVPVAGADVNDNITNQLTTDNEVVEVNVNYNENIINEKNKNIVTNEISFNKAIAINDTIVYKDKNTEKSLGKLFNDNIATVIERDDNWSHIMSGDLDGYIENKNILINDEAKAYLFQDEIKGTIKEDTFLNSNEGERQTWEGVEYIIKDINDEKASIEINNTIYSIELDKIEIDFNKNNGQTNAEIKAEEEKQEAERIAREEAERKAKEEEERKAREETERLEEERINAQKEAEAVEQAEAIAIEQATNNTTSVDRTQNAIANADIYNSIAQSNVNYGVDTTGWQTGVASAYGGYSDASVADNARTATGATVTETSMGVAVPMAWPNFRSYYGHTVLISYRGKTVSAVINDCGGMGNGSRSLDLQPGVFRAFGFTNCFDWGLRTVSYKIL